MSHEESMPLLLLASFLITFGVLGILGAVLRHYGSKNARNNTKQ